MQLSHRAGSPLLLVVIVSLLAAACGSGPSPATSPPGGSVATAGLGAPSQASSRTGPTSAAPGLGVAASSPGPSASGGTASGIGASWTEATVALPSEVTSAATEPPGVICSPCHAIAEDQFLGVSTMPGGFIAVGVEQPPPEAIAFGSSDGLAWSQIAGFPSGAGSTAIAAAANATTTVVVGSNHDGALSWSTSGSGWATSPRQASLLVPYAAGAMMAVIPFEGGFVAGGYRDDPLAGTAQGAIWRSTDGLTWALDPSSAFAGARIQGLAARGDTLVAVGTKGDPNYGPVGAWRWTKESGWQPASVLPDAGGAMRAVVATSRGFVAVGLDAHDTGAMTWTSGDGLTWKAAADQPAFHHGTLPVRMQAIVAVSAGFVAGGWRSDVGKGSAVSWTSADGITWNGPAWQVSFSGAQIRSAVAGPSEVVAVGRTGYPDNNQASAWVVPIP
jgi:hypothetical protein